MRWFPQTSNFLVWSIPNVRRFAIQEIQLIKLLTSSLGTLINKNSIGKVSTPLTRHLPNSPVVLWSFSGSTRNWGSPDWRSRCDSEHTGLGNGHSRRGCPFRVKWSSFVRVKIRRTKVVIDEQAVLIHEVFMTRVTWTICVRGATLRRPTTV